MPEDWTFSTADDAVAFFEKAAQDDGVPATLSSTHRARLAREFEVIVEESPPPGSRGLVIKSLRWVIQAEDLGFFKSLLDAVKAAATAGFFFAVGATETTSAIVGVAVAALL